MTNPDQAQNDGQQQKFHQNREFGDYVKIFAYWVVALFAIPSSFFAHILAQFLERGGSGSKILGAMGFFVGTMFGADSIWQTFFQGTPIFPWWENEWIGWGAWPALLINVPFWCSVGISALIQVMESRTLRGKSPEEARREFENAKQYTLPEKPKGVIDLTRALWGDYKVAGMKERNGGGLIAALFWIGDLVSTFVGRNPFRYTNPIAIIGCLAYNILTMIAGETGYKIWKETSKR